MSFCLFSGFGYAGYAQAPDSVQTTQQELVVRLPHPEKLAALRADKDFDYHEQVQQDSSFWDRFTRKVRSWINNLFFKGKSSSFWEFVIYALMVGIVVYVIVKMQKVGITENRSKMNIAGSMPYDVVEENIHALDLNQLIEEAINNQELRKAIRLHYLLSLKKLTDANLINWQPGKTNRSYISEIQHPHLRQEFEQLTSMFEYVWYGGAGLGTELFSTARAEFLQFDALIKQHA